ncbi:NAD-dependent epimerase/dehydratase family protein [uncultured Megasphaera sp.]|uniref:NAD-dependent epimerase/dehydratase family protein n=1 Tax=uncultured Megasphaera sp. TaxID=165188 RepID=UPI0028683C2E|nr:NAD-dependent epimerase/dehydratase family protein [uncultured Megasphaera sp.]
MHILITGKAGGLASCLADVLTEAGHQADIAPVFPENPTFDAVCYGTDLSRKETAAADLRDILEACCCTAVRRFILFSSAAVYGETDGKRVDEAAPTAPVSELGRILAAEEDLVRRYEAERGLQAVILRCGNIYGEGLEDDVVSRFASAVARGREMTIFGDGDQSRDFVYIKDVARAAAAAVDSQAAPGIYNIGTQIETTVNAVKEILLYFSHAGSPVSYKEAREGDVRCSALNNEKAIAALKWRPKMKLMPGLMATYQYFLEKEDTE